MVEGGFGAAFRVRSGSGFAEVADADGVALGELDVTAVGPRVVAAAREVAGRLA